MVSVVLLPKGQWDITGSLYLGAQHIKGYAHPSPLAALPFPDSIRYPFTAWLTEFYTRKMAQLGFKPLIFQPPSVP